MLHLVDQALEAFLRSSAPLPETTIDVSFDAPDKKWGAAITRPTVNLFLYMIGRSPSRTQAGLREREIDGEIYRRGPNPVVELAYYMTAWAPEVGDEHQILGSVLRSTLGNAQVPTEQLPPELAAVAPLKIDVAMMGQLREDKLWNLLDGQLKPGVGVTATLEVDALAWLKAGPPTESLDLGIGRDVPQTSRATAPPRRARARRTASVVAEGAPDQDT